MVVDRAKTGGGEREKESGLMAEFGERGWWPDNTGQLRSKTAVSLGFLMPISGSERLADKLRFLAHFSHAHFGKLMRMGQALVTYCYSLWNAHLRIR